MAVFVIYLITMWAISPSTTYETQQTVRLVFFGVMTLLALLYIRQHKPKNSTLWMLAAALAVTLLLHFYTGQQSIPSGLFGR
jgi:uncharacterized membrane protein YhhN